TWLFGENDSSRIKDFYLSQWWLCNPRLVRKSAIQLLISFLAGNAVMRNRLQHGGNKREVRIHERDRKEFGVVGSSIVEVLIGKDALPDYSLALAKLFFAFCAALVSFCADDQNEIGLTDLPVHPLGPAFRGRRLVLINVGVNTVYSQSISQIQY